jgi:hypothetical protein
MSDRGDRASPCRRLADALRHRTVDLALEQQRVERPADIAHHGKPRERHVAGFRIDLDFGRVTAVWEARRI